MIYSRTPFRLDGWASFFIEFLQEGGEAAPYPNCVRVGCCAALNRVAIQWSRRTCLQALSKKKNTAEKSTRILQYCNKKNILFYSGFTVYSYYFAILNHN